jgi:hypothetical protein
MGENARTLSVNGKAIMKKPPTTGLPEQYLKALKEHLEQGAQENLQLQSAYEMGSLAVLAGLETLELAKLHDHAMEQLLSPADPEDRRADWTRRGVVFFTEANVPIENKHSSALAADADLNELNATLDQRTLDLARSNSELQQQIALRRSAEVSVQTGALASDELLKDSRILEKDLQSIAQKIISVTEEERKKMSLHLNDEIAQTMLAIHIRMLALQKMLAASDSNLTTEISSIQRLIEDSSVIIHRLAYEFKCQHAGVAD